MNTLILMDGPNIFTQLRSINRRMDYAKLMTFFSHNGSTPRVNYYTAEYKDDVGLNKMQAFTDWLQYNGIRLITKPAIVHQRGGNDVIKGNLDVEIVVDSMAALSWAQTYVFFTGDGDFKYLCNYLRAQGKHVIVCAVSKCEPGAGYIDGDLHHLSDELRRGCDQYMNLNAKGDPSHNFTIPDKGPPDSKSL